jgi:DNA repair exonuclease SbcCD ATPase subunit
MSTTVSSPAASADTSDADILAIATAADEGRELPAATTAAPSHAPEEKTPAPSGDNDESVTKAAQDGDKKPAPEKPKADDKPATDKPETPFTKAQKDKERLGRSWKDLETEKTQFKQEKATLTQELENLRREVTELKSKPAAPASSEPMKDEHGHTAATYEAVAKKAAAENDTEIAALARQKASALKQKQQQAQPPAAASATAGETWKTPEFQQQWAANAAAIVQAEPALGDPENPVFKSVQHLVNQSPFASLLKSRPDGIRAAVEVAKLQIQAAEATKLREQLTAKDAEIARLNKLTAPLGAPPGGGPTAPKRIEEMSADEAEAHVRQLAAAADRGEV